MFGRIFALAAVVGALVIGTAPAHAVTVTTDEAAFTSIRNVDYHQFPFNDGTFYSPTTSYTQAGVTFEAASGLLYQIGAPFCDGGSTACLNTSLLGGAARVSWSGPVLGLYIQSRSLLNSVLNYELNGVPGSIGIPIGNITSDVVFLGIDLGHQGSIDLLLDPTRTGGIAITQFLTAAPEPATWGMMILGFGVVGGLLRRETRRRLREVYA